MLQDSVSWKTKHQAVLCRGRCTKKKYSMFLCERTKCCLADKATICFHSLFHLHIDIGCVLNLVSSTVQSKPTHAQHFIDKITRLHERLNADELVSQQVSKTLTKTFVKYHKHIAKEDTTQKKLNTEKVSVAFGMTATKNKALFLFFFCCKSKRAMPELESPENLHQRSEVRVLVRMFVCLHTSRFLFASQASSRSLPSSFSRTMEHAPKRIFKQLPKRSFKRLLNETQTLHAQEATLNRKSSISSRVDGERFCCRKL